MNVLMIAAYPSETGSPQGGVEAATVNLVEALAARNDVRVTVLDLRPGKAQTQLSRLNGYDVIRAASGPAVGRLRRSRLAIAEVLEAGDFSIVHSQGAAGLLPRGIPNVLTIHGFIERDAEFRHARLANQIRKLTVVRTEVRARTNTQNVIAISEETVRRLPERKGRDVYWIPNAVSPIMKPSGPMPAGSRILYAGHLREIKNIGMLLRSFAHLKGVYPESELRIAGSGATAYVESCEELATRLGIADSVAWLGALSQSELAKELALTRVLALPSWTENAPMVVSEALSVGVPVVATHVGAVAEMIGNGAGLTVRPGDERAFSDALAEVVHTDDSSQRRDAALRQSRRYRADTVAQQTVECYQCILARIA